MHDDRNLQGAAAAHGGSDGIVDAVQLTLDSIDFRRQVQQRHPRRWRRRQLQPRCQGHLVCLRRSCKICHEVPLACTHAGSIAASIKKPWSFGDRADTRMQTAALANQRYVRCTLDPGTNGAKMHMLIGKNLPGPVV